MKKRKKYTDQELSNAVSRVLAGEGPTAVAEDTRVPVRTIAKYVKMHRDGTPTIHARRGQPPMLTVDGEADLVSWIHGMQSNGTPACRAEILMQGSKIATMLSGERVVLSDGWYGKFMGRNKELTDRQAQTVSRTRNECSLQKLSLLFQTLLKVIIEDNLDATRIYNMDETSFMTRKKSARVIALRGSRNVWTKTISPNFHLSVVACGSASGHVIPPLFILPGQRLSHHIMDECNVSGARVTSTSSGFINRAVFVKWVHFFSNSVPSTVKRPLLLLFDGYLSHLSLELIQAGEALGIRFVCLPANATHLVQPMDIAVFSSYKKRIRALVRKFMFDTGTSVLVAFMFKMTSCTNCGGYCVTLGSYHIDKRAAIRLGSAAWNESVIGSNSKSGFRATGLFPLSTDQLRRRYDLFNSGGARKKRKTASWLQHRAAVRAEILTLPARGPEERKRPTRKTVDVAGRLLTREDLVIASRSVAETEA